MALYRYEFEVVDVIDGYVRARNKKEALDKIGKEALFYGQVIGDIDLEKIPKNEEEDYA